jgi:hypothetical protein
VIVRAATLTTRPEMRVPSLMINVSADAMAGQRHHTDTHRRGDDNPSL